MIEEDDYEDPKCVRCGEFILMGGEIRDAFQILEDDSMQHAEWQLCIELKRAKQGKVVGEKW